MVAFSLTLLLVAGAVGITIWSDSDLWHARDAKNVSE
jgi:hypothetical protein